jgi:hypothetical protein
MSTTTNEIILENLVRDIEELGSSVEEFIMLFPEYSKVTDVDKMEKMQDYINYLKYKQAQDKMEPDWDKVL